MQPSPGRLTHTANQLVDGDGPDPAGLSPTRLNSTLPVHCSGFGGLAEALVYAAQGETGYNFYDHRGQLESVLTYRDLLVQSRSLAHKLAGLGCSRGARVGIVAETDPSFLRFFFACQFAGLVPVPVPGGMQLGARKAYTDQIRRMLRNCGARVAMAPESHLPFLRELEADLDLRMCGGPAEFDALPEDAGPLQPARGSDPAYLQYTSGSTQFPRGVAIGQDAVLENLREIALSGLQLRAEDRFVSWLPFYHDMGMVGFILVPLIAQLSADFLAPSTFAMRPRLWLKILSDNRGTVASSPTFGYALCARRLRAADTERYDLSNWRAACVGAEQIKPQALMEFARALEPCGFKAQAFTACYGMAETVLAISFAPLDTGLVLDHVDAEQMRTRREARPAAPGAPGSAAYVDCGAVLPGFEFRVCDENGVELPERHCGTIQLRGPSVMTGYFSDREATARVLSSEGWLDTGDIGYRLGRHLVITARAKDVIIIKGRNIWPHDLESVVEQIDGIRLGGVAAFCVARHDEEDLAVVVAETRDYDPVGREGLVEAIRAVVHEHFGIQVEVDLVKPGTLPRTSSGKLSRSLSRQGYFERQTSREQGSSRPATVGVRQSA